MINIPKEDLIKMRGGEEQAFYNAILDMMIELKDWDISDMPLPTFLALAKRLRFHNEQMKSEMKCQSRHKG
jgi:hypothetical protein